jgi:hypothetical protein
LVVSSVLLERNSTREAEPEPAWRKRAVAALLIYEPIPSKDRRLVRLGKTAMFKSDPGTVDGSYGHIRLDFNGHSLFSLYSTRPIDGAQTGL